VVCTSNAPYAQCHRHVVRRRIWLLADQNLKLGCTPTISIFGICVWHFSPNDDFTGRLPCADQRGWFLLACSEPWWFSTRIRTTTRSKEGGNSRVWSDERPQKWVDNRWRRRRAVTVPGVALQQARTHVQKERGSAFHSLYSSEQKDRSPTVGNVKLGTILTGHWLSTWKIRPFFFTFIIKGQLLFSLL